MINGTDSAITFLTEKQLEEQLSVSRTTIWRWRRQGKLNCYKLGTKVAFSLAHVKELLEKCEQRADQRIRIKR
jgi:excisionase family DNA binding protein